MRGPRWSYGQQHATAGDQALGGAQLFWSTAQLIGGVGLLLTPEPTMLTKAGGVVLAAHGIDSGVAAGRQIWTGETTEDLTQQAGEKIALGFGASIRAAYRYGVAFDAAVPLGTGIALGAERVLAIRGGRLSLAAEEAAGATPLPNTSDKVKRLCGQGLRRNRKSQQLPPSHLCGLPKRQYPTLTGQ